MTYSESELQFEFDDQQWGNLLEFDKTKDFQNAQEALPSTKGVDFIGINKEDALVFIEVKNFRGHRIENKPRIEDGEDPLWMEVAQKMRDSISVIVGGSRNSTHQKETWTAYFDYLKSEEKTLHFVLWLEQDLPPTNFKAKKKWDRNEYSLRKRLKNSLRWLSSKVDIASMDNNPFPTSLNVNHLTIT
ncbi:MAG: hypothetical protein R2788_00215 [Saprospiraceae bacterium]